MGKHQKNLTIFVAVLCAVCLSVLFRLGLFSSFELKSLDLRFHAFAQSRTPDKNVVLVAIDEASLREFKHNNIVWKWPRDIYAFLVDYLHRGGAKAIIFDIIFADHDIDRLSSDAEETDGALATAMKHAGNVLLAMHLRQEEDLLSGSNPLIIQNPLRYDGRWNQVPLIEFSDALLPIPLFQKAAFGVGVTNYLEDSDGICRRLPLFFRHRDRIFPHLGLLAYAVANRVDSITFQLPNKIQLDGSSIPVNEKGEFQVYWYGRGGPEGCFPYYSIGPLITSALAESRGQTPLIPSSTFKEKIVIIGSNAPALADFRNTPFSTYEPYPGMEIFATAISNFSQHDFLCHAPAGITIAVIFLFIFLIFFAFFRLKRITWVVLLSAFWVFLWVVVSFAFFRFHLVWLDLAAPLLSIFVAFAASAVLSYQTEGRARRKLRAVFGKYLSPIVISEVIEKKETLQLGGEEIRATIYFSDIKDFTTISERTSPPELVTLLNEYFSLLTDVILQYHGLLDKYIGDAIMAVFGAPIPREDHAMLACSAALEVQRVLQESWNHPASDKPRLFTRIGINTGDIVVGNIGSSLRLDYTAIGDSVNLASRLEGVNKIFTTKIIISQTTYRDVQEHFLTRPLDLLRVKGKERPVKIYELMGKKEGTNGKLKSLAERFNTGFECYQRRSFQEALDIFQLIQQDFPDDGPVGVYLNRCQKYVRQPPPATWDGVFKMETK